jgi:predicted PurR-regulated permease PerM
MTSKIIYNVLFIVIALVLFGLGYEGVLVGFVIGHLFFAFMDPIVNKLRERRKDKNVVRNT